MNSYVTVPELKAELDYDLFDTEIDDDLARKAIDASRALDRWVSGGSLYKRWFYPLLATYTYDHPVTSGSEWVPDTTGLLTGIVVESNQALRVERDLLEVTSLTTRNGEVAISSSDYTLRRLFLPAGPPYDVIQLLDDGTVGSFDWTGSPEGANSVTGWWGYHEEWADAWEDSGDEIEDNPLSDSATTITVNDATGRDLQGFSPRFGRLAIIKIDDEVMQVTNVESNTLTVIRGANGTTAAAHLQNATIYLYRPMTNVRDATRLIAAQKIRRKDTIGSDDNSKFRSRKGTFLTPTAWPEEAVELMWHLTKGGL